MQFKESVEWYGMDIRLVAAMDRVDEITKSILGRQAIITAARDGHHKEGSLHYVGRAVDMRCKDFPAAKGIALRMALQACLGGDFQFIFEAEDATPNTTAVHVHAELDPKNYHAA